MVMDILNILIRPCTFPSIQILPFSRIKKLFIHLPRLIIFTLRRHRWRIMAEDIIILNISSNNRAHSKECYPRQPRVLRLLIKVMASLRVIIRNIRVGTRLILLLKVMDTAMAGGIISLRHHLRTKLPFPLRDTGTVHTTDTDTDTVQQRRALQRGIPCQDQETHQEEGTTHLHTVDNLLISLLLLFLMLNILLNINNILLNISSNNISNSNNNNSIGVPRLQVLPPLKDTPPLLPQLKLVPVLIPAKDQGLTLAQAPDQVLGRRIMHLHHLHHPLITHIHIHKRPLIMHIPMHTHIHMRR
jgi:hypothetical protein